MRNVSTFNEVNSALRDIFNALDALRVRDIDLKGRRVVNASPSNADSDYVTRKELVVATSEKFNDSSIRGLLTQIQAKVNYLDKLTKYLAWQSDCMGLEFENLFTEQLPAIWGAIGAINSGLVIPVELPTQPELVNCEEALGPMPVDPRN